MRHASDAARRLYVHARRDRAARQVGCRESGQTVKWLLALVWGIVLGVALACGSGSPTPSPSPTPASPREFVLRSRELTYDDYLVALNLLGLDSRWTPIVQEGWGKSDHYFRGFAATYVARECLAGRLPSGEGFIAFVVANGKPSPREVLIPLAQTVLADIFGQEASSQATRGCLRIYFAPVDGGEARLAVELVVVPLTYRMNPSVRDGAAGLHMVRARAWFTPEGKARGSLLRLLCEGYPCLP